MKRILLAILLVALLIGCSAKKAPEEPKEPEVVVEDVPKAFTMTLIASTSKPLLGEGEVIRGKLVPEALELAKGDTLRIENRDINYETIQIIQVKKDYKQSKFRTLLKEDLAKGEIVEYPFNEDGLYKVKCLFSGCVSTVAVA